MNKRQILTPPPLLHRSHAHMHTRSCSHSPSLIIPLDCHALTKRARLTGTRHLNYSLGTLYVLWMLFRHLTGSSAKHVSRIYISIYIIKRAGREEGVNLWCSLGFPLLLSLLSVLFFSTVLSFCSNAWQVSRYP